MHNQDRLRELSEYIEKGRKVNEMLESDGWKEIIEPMLDKMISDVIGAKEEGRWHNGSISLSSVGTEEAKSLIAYKRALTDFHNYVYDIVETSEQSELEYKELIVDGNKAPEEFESEYNVGVIQ